MIFLAIVLAALVALYVVGLKRSQSEHAILTDALAEPVAALPGVLFPASPAPNDVDRVRFSLGLRGYRMDQVDEVLDRLRDELAAKDARITELESGVAAPASEHKPADTAEQRAED